MPWQLKAEGYALSEKAEKKLFRLLGKLFGDKKYGAVHPIQFTGDHVSGSPLNETDLALAKDVSVDDEDEAQAGLVQKGESYPAKHAEIKLPSQDGEESDKSEDAESEGQKSEDA